MLVGTDGRGEQLSAVQLGGYAVSLLGFLVYNLLRLPARGGAARRQLRSGAGAPSVAGPTTRASTRAKAKKAE